MVVGVRGLDGIDVDDGQGVLRTESKGRGLDTSIIVGAVGGAMKWHDGRVTKNGDCVRGKHGSVLMLAKECDEGSVRRMGSVNYIFVGFLDGEDVKVLG